MLALTLLPFALRKVDRFKTDVFFRTLGLSLAVQVLALLAFWLCFKSLGHTIPIFLCVTVCAGIFIAAVIPAAVGGFGARELGAVAFMMPLGISAEVSFTASVLYGLMATIQGVTSLYWWIKR